MHWDERLAWLAGGAALCLAIQRAASLIQRAHRPERRGAGMGHSEFVEHGASLVQWISEYRQRVQRGEFPVRSCVKPGYLAALISKDIPQRGEPWEAIMRDVEDAILPGITHWESPSFFAYFKPHGSYPSVLGEMLCAGFNAMGFSWIASPACTELETIVLDALARAIGLPPAFLSDSASGGGGVIQGSAGEATVVAVIAARTRALSGFSAEDREKEALRLVLYSSDQTHSVLENACMILGIPLARYRKLPTRRENAFAMDPETFRAAVQEDRSKGLLPFFVCCTVGTTSTGAFDPLDSVGAICKEENIWLHVDGAWGGVAPICPEHAGRIRGVELADSYNTNAHKQLMTNFDCSPMWVQERRWLLNALSLTPEYLRNKESDKGTVIDYKDWQIPLGRRFRSLKLWFVLRTYGIEGLQAHLRHGYALAEGLAAHIRASKDFQLFVEPSLSLVCFQALDGSGTASEALSSALLDRVNASGKAFLIHSKIQGEFFIRVACGGLEQSETHVDALWNLIKAEASALRSTSA